MPIGRNYFCKVLVSLDRDRLWALFNSVLTFVVPKMQAFLDKLRTG
jgi:hypothetical protein